LGVSFAALGGLAGVSGVVSATSSGLGWRWGALFQAVQSTAKITTATIAERIHGSRFMLFSLEKMTKATEMRYRPL
jgi:hypothetical protein